MRLRLCRPIPPRLLYPVRPSIIVCFALFAICFTVLGVGSYPVIFQVIRFYRPSAVAYLPMPGRSSAEYARAPELHPELLSAPLPTSWRAPMLTRPRYHADWAHGDVGSGNGRTTHSAKPDLARQNRLKSPALLLLHIFSTASREGRAKREEIREAHPLNLLDPDYRHLVEVKFVLPPSPAEENAKEEKRIKRENTTYADLIRMPSTSSLAQSETVTALDWVTEVGRGTIGRETAWAFKSDQNTFTILPNLLNAVLAQDFLEPTYVGESWTTTPRHLHHFDGRLVGYSFGLLRTIAAANLSLSDMDMSGGEDAAIGELMYSLPHQTGCEDYDYAPIPACDPRRPPQGENWDWRPDFLDPRTGLRRVDLTWRIWHRAGRYSQGSVGVANLTAPGELKTAYEEAEAYSRLVGKWKPPKSMRNLKEWLADGTAQRGRAR